MGLRLKFVKTLVNIEGFYMLTTNASTPVLNRNTIKGGIARHHSKGVYNNNQSAPIIDSCDINGGSGDSSVGIYNYQQSNPLIVMNDIVGGEGVGRERSIGIYNASCPHRFGSSSVQQHYPGWRR
jgi:hypothetical protein